jgi:hypothetical protein
VVGGVGLEYMSGSNRALPKNIAFIFQSSEQAINSVTKLSSYPVSLASIAIFCINRLRISRP